MPRKESETVPEGNGPVPQQEEIGSGEPKLADVYRLFEERFDRQHTVLPEMAAENNGQQVR